MEEGHQTSKKNFYSLLARFARRGNARYPADTEKVFGIWRDIKVYTEATFGRLLQNVGHFPKRLGFKRVLTSFLGGIICRFGGESGTFVCRFGVDLGPNVGHLSVDYLWIICGLSVDYLWIICRLSVDLLWILVLE